MRYSQVFSQISKELNIPLDAVEKAYVSYWQFIRETIKALPLKEDLTEEQFSKLRTNFNLPSLGNFNCTYEGMTKVKERNKKLKELKDAKDKENQAHVHRIDNIDGQI